MVHTVVDNYKELIQNKVSNMKVKVWDTYVKKKNGNVIHFDIIVPESVTDESLIYDFGKRFIISQGEADAKLDSEECQFCHIEEPTEEMFSAIADKGFYILEMDEIPAKLDSNPSRRDMIMYLKAHFKEYRFENFKGVSKEEVEYLLKKLE